MGWLDGDVALITGGGSGLGHALTARFVDEGAKVGVLERSADKAAALRNEFDDRVLVIEGDVTRYGDNERAVTQVVNNFGKLDTFVGNAGLWDFERSLMSFSGDELSAGFNELFGVNVKGYMLGARAACEALIATKGTIIFTASPAGLRPAGGGVLYVSSKHAVIGVMHQLAYELAPDVRVNVVAPGRMGSDLRGPGVLGQDQPSELSHGAGATSRYHTLAIDVQPFDYTGAFVLLASRQNSRTATGVLIDLSATSVGGRQMPRVRELDQQQA